TILGVVASAVLLGGAASAGGAVQHAPRTGVWIAVGTSIQRVGGGWADPPGSRFVRDWQIARRCSGGGAGSCHYQLRRATSEGLRSTKLVRAADGSWRTTQVVMIACDYTPSTGQPIVGPETVTLTLKFNRSGKRLTANERKTFS